MDITALITLLLFVGVAQLLVKTSIKPTTASLLVVLPPFLVASLIKWILLANIEAPFWGNVITFNSLLLLAIQFGIGAFVFKCMQNTDDSVEKWLAWSVLGIALIILIAPLVVQSVFRF